MNRKVNRVGSVVVALLAVAVTCAMPIRPAQADLLISWPDITVFGDGVNPTTGSFDVRLTLTEPELSTPPSLSSFNLHFTVSSPDVTLGTPSTPTLDPLFANASIVNQSTSLTVKWASDINDLDPPSSLAFQNAGLLTVPFSVAAGQFGTYTFAFGNMNELGDEFGASLAVNYQAGAIHVAIPESAAWKNLGAVAALACAVVLAIKLRRRAAIGLS